MHARGTNSRKFTSAAYSHGHGRQGYSEDRPSRRRAVSAARCGEDECLSSFEEVDPEEHARGNTSRRKRRYSESSTRFYKTEDYNQKYEKSEEKKPFHTYKKRLHCEIALSSDRFEDYDSQTTNDDCVVTCPFCDKKILQSRLKSHMKNKHKENLFSCDGSCEKKFKSAWRSEVVTHLKMVHKLDMSDSILFRHFLRHPISKAMVCCKVSECEEAIFLGRTVAQVEKMMTRHVEKYHKGQLAGDWFNLGCRSCSSVYKTNEEAEWEKHLSLDHIRMPKNIRPRSVSSSKIYAGSSGPGSADENSNDVDVKNEERLVRLVSGTTSPVSKTEVAMTVCKFCGEMVEKADHEQAMHLAKLFSCKNCHEDGNSWVGQTASELVSHVTEDHQTDLKFEDISAPGNQYITLSICTVCQAQFYTRDPSILATHLLDHELGPDMKKFIQCCRICFSMKGSMTPVKNPGLHYEEVHCSSNIITHHTTMKEEKVEALALTTQIDDDSQPCSYCGETQDTKNDLSVHISTHHFQQRFQCTICEESKNTSCIAMFEKLDCPQAGEVTCPDHPGQGCLLPHHPLSSHLLSQSPQPSSEGAHHTFPAYSCSVPDLPGYSTAGQLPA